MSYLTTTNLTYWPTPTAYQHYMHLCYWFGLNYQTIFFCTMSYFLGSQIMKPPATFLCLHLVLNRAAMIAQMATLWLIYTAVLQSPQHITPDKPPVHHFFFPPHLCTWAWLSNYPPGCQTTANHSPTISTFSELLSFMDPNDLLVYAVYCVSNSFYYSSIYLQSIIQQYSFKQIVLSLVLWYIQYQHRYPKNP